MGMGGGGGDGGGMMDPVVFGLTSALRTGNVAVDLLLVALLPTLLTLAASALRLVGPTLRAMREGRRRQVFRRVIRCERRVRRWCTRAVDREARNGILHKAIALYVSRNALLDDEAWAKLRLMGPSSEQEEVIHAVPDEDWVEVGEGVRLMRCEADDGQGGDEKTESTTEITDVILEVESASAEPIERFVRAALDYYVAKVEAEEEKGRHLYVPRPVGAPGSDEDGDDSAPQFTRYKLTDETTFATLWFPEKEGLVSLLDAFLERRGRYGVKGAARKLGVLLHAETPGCGTTSLIKAIAHRANRNVVVVDLAKIRTNQQLVDAVFDLRFAVPDLDCPVRLDFESCVFVFEGIDTLNAALSRDLRAAPSKKLRPKADDDPVLKLLSSVAFTATDQRPSLDAILDTDDDDLLDLSGILNVLDGVLDSPGRIALIASTRPDRLDPALLRPGRIDLTICLTHLDLPSALSLVDHHLSPGLLADPAARDAFSRAFLATSKPITPAHLEQLCADSVHLDDLIHALDGLPLDDDCAPSSLSSPRLPANHRCRSAAEDELAD